MAGFYLHQSNRMERLAGALAGRVRRQGGDPLVPVTVVVQNQGMARWLSLVLAEELGVWANFRFPFPNAILWEIFEKFLPGEKPGELFEPLPLAFRAMEALEGTVPEEAFLPLRRYLGEEGDDLRRFQLAARVADVYDQYATYRPEWILDWTEGKGSGWPAELWRRMVSAGEQAAHRPAMFQRFAARVRAGGEPPAGLPDPLHVFGLSTLPLLHLETLAALSRFVEVRLYLLNPCREFWLDIRSDKVQVKQSRRLTAPVPSADLHFERGHALLASQGTLGQEFLQLLQPFDPLEEDDLYVDPGKGSLLARLQRDILELGDRAEGPGIPIPRGDDSIRVHSCHGPMREMEVLRDALLRRFEEDPELEPRQVLVMAPDIEAYAPYIEAVFGGEPDPQLRIPFSIADRGREQELPTVRAFLRILDLEGGRFEAAELLDLLEEPPVAAVLELVPGELEQLRSWIAETRVRWGIDGAFRASLGLPPHPENSWRAGMDRMLLGYALPGEERRMFAGILPYDEIEGSAAGLLGRFCRFAERLFAAILDLARPRSLSGWEERFRELAETFLAPGEGQVVLGRGLEELGRCRRLAGYEAPVSFAVARSVLERVLATRSTAGFLRGGVTFCSLLPMRSIPFEVIAMVGMNDGEFPRRSASSGLDLMADGHRPGDPSRRKEDRFLFLEALLSARRALHLSYCGQSVRDNSESPPSVVVSELLDVLEQKYLLDDGSSSWEGLRVRHRLQAFHPDYFRRGQNLYSYSGDNFRGARVLVAGRGEARPFMAGELPEPGEEWLTPALAELVAFFRNPARFFLRRRLDIRLDDREESLPVSEPFTLEGLERFQLKKELARRLLAGEEAEEVFGLARARGVLPPGPMARPAFERCLAEAAELVRRVGARLDPTFPPESLEVDLRLGIFRLTGRLEGVVPSGLLRWRCAKIRDRDRVGLWIEHLVLCCLRGEASAPESLLLGEGGKSFRLAPAVSCRELLASLLEAYRRGLRAPLPFFPESSLAFARKIHSQEPEGKGLGAARSAWEGSDWSRGEGDEREYDYCFGRTDPFDGKFRGLARELLLPLLEHGRGG